MKSRTAVRKDYAKLKAAKAGATLETLFVDFLKDIYWAEMYLVKMLPKLSKAAGSEEVTDSIAAHLQETQLQVGRIEKCFEVLGIKAVGKKCPAMEGLVREATDLMREFEEGVVRDAALIASIQKIEHYEISAYETLRKLATLMGKVQCAQLLEESKDEESKSDAELGVLADKLYEAAGQSAVSVS